MSCKIQTLIDIATNEVGYLEKKSNSMLDVKTANAGSANYTKYNRDYISWGAGGAINMQWCAAFVSWCFVKAYGLDAAKKLLCGGLHHYTPTGANRFKAKGRYTKRGKGTPQIGDVIYFYSSAKGRIGHVGIVYKVDSSKVYTIEGNTSGASELITNGGGVKKKSYKLTSTYIDGYGRPDFENIEPSSTDDTTTYELGDRLLKLGCEGDDVKELQKALVSLGYSCGSWGADGEYGDATEIAVRNFQNDTGLEQDGQYGEKTHAALTTALDKNAEPSEVAEHVKIVGGQCWVRVAPLENGNKLGVASEGSTWEYTGKESGKWLQIVFEDQKGWVSNKYAKVID